ncbi:unnamed protein product [Orchesella dallaii]|uniref:Uncharacterized protein n=1 Tax=Orchesella dallaii TaxID=48710 RepID=A0ABP1PV71_9HEXA
MSAELLYFPLQPLDLLLSLLQQISLGFPRHLRRTEEKSSVLPKLQFQLSVLWNSEDGEGMLNSELGIAVDVDHHRTPL